jgi:hypothetical protein
MSERMLQISQPNPNPNPNPKPNPKPNRNHQIPQSITPIVFPTLPYPPSLSSSNNFLNVIEREGERERGRERERERERESKQLPKCNCSKSSK